MRSLICPYVAIALCLSGGFTAAEDGLEPLVSSEPLAPYSAADDEQPPTASAPSESLPPAPEPTTHFDTSVRLDGLEIETSDESGNQQKSSGVDVDWVGSYLVGDDDRFNLWTIETRHRPLDSIARASRLTTQPGGGITWINGDPSLDLPDRLYHFAIPIQIDLSSNENVVIDLNVTPAWFTDGVNRRPEMFRLQGGSNIYYRLNPRDSLTAGFVYLNRDDIPALPVFGMLIHDEDAGRRLELVFPQPRLMWRLSPRNGSSIWGVITGELGGGSWAVKRADRTPDVLTYRDYRLTGGIEVRSHDGLRGMLEAGWVFGRRLESRTGLGVADLTDGFLARLWFEY